MPDGYFERQEFASRVIRDADMMQNLNDTIISNVVGIKSELFRNTAWDKYLDDTVTFLRNIQFYTDAGKAVAAPLIEQAVEIVQRINKAKKKNENH